MPKQNRWTRILVGLLLTAAALVSQAAAQAPQPLSPDARVSLITVSPGVELYSAYGHSALRVVDPQLGIDYVFNYGTFDFQTEGFYLKFARGRLDYMLSIHGFDLLLAAAAEDRRSVTEQVLALDRAQTARLFELLMVNYRPENRFYRYDFFYDNCATRLRDLLETACGKELTWGPTAAPRESFRQLIHPYHTPLVDLGIDLALGRPTDRVATGRDHAFLPNELLALFAGGQLGGAPLVRQQVVVLAMPSPALAPWWQHQWPALVALLVMTFLIWTVGARAYAIRQGREGAAYRMPLLVRVLFIAVGLIGLVLAFLTFFTDHAATAWNLNLLWASPTHLWLVWALGSPRRRENAKHLRHVRAYCWVAGVACLLAVVVDVTGVQDLHQVAVQLSIGLGSVLLHLAVFGPGPHLVRTGGAMA